MSRNNLTTILPHKIKIHYAEARGQSALAVLRAWCVTLPGYLGFLSAELLISSSEPDLVLVASRWIDKVPQLSLPDGVLSWVFEVAD